MTKQQQIDALQKQLDAAKYATGVKKEKQGDTNYETTVNIMSL